MVVALHRAAQSLHRLYVDMLESTERLRHDRPPEWALAKRLAASAKLILGKAAAPDIPQLTDRDKAFHLPQEAQQERTAASAVTANIEQFNFLAIHYKLNPFNMVMTFAHLLFIASSSRTTSEGSDGYWTRRLSENSEVFPALSVAVEVR